MYGLLTTIHNLGSPFARAIGNRLYQVGRSVCAAPPPGARTLIPIVRTVTPIVRTLIPIVRAVTPIVRAAIRIIGSNCIRFGSASTGVQRWRTALALSRQCNVWLPSVLRSEAD